MAVVLNCVVVDAHQNVETRRCVKQAGSESPVFAELNHVDCAEDETAQVQTGSNGVQHNEPDIHIFI